MNSPPPDLKLLWKQYKPIITSLLLVSALYFLLRIANLTLLPIFADEGIYIRWAQVMRSEATLRFLPLSDGKQPLFMWLTILFLKVIKDPLFAGRFLSVLSGLGSLIALFFLTLQLTKSQKHALTSSFLYAIVPFTFFFDRMALVDSLLTMFGIWAIYFAFKLLHKPQLSFSMLTGSFLGAAWLTKSPAIFFLGLLPLTGITINYSLKNRSRIKFNQFITPKKWYFIKLFWFWGISFTIAFAIYNILRLGPEFHMLATRTKDYLYPLNEILQHPTSPLIENLKNVFEFYWKLLTPSIFIVTLIGILLIFKKNYRLILYLLAWILGPIMLQSLFARSVTARYFLFTIPPVLILSSYGIQWLLNKYKQQTWKIIIAAVIIVPSLWFNFLLITNLQKANLPRIERNGYLEEWTAGSGLREITNYINQQAIANSIVVGTEGFFGTMPDGIQIYFDKHPNVTILGQTHIIDHVPQVLYDSFPQNKVYLLVNDTRFKISDPESVGLELITSYPKAQRPDGSREHLLFFEVTSRPNNT